MPVSSSIDPDRGLVVTTWTGDVTLEEAHGHNESLRSDPDFDPRMDQLSDARNVTSPVRVDGIRHLAKTSPFGEGSRRAIVAATDIVFGVSRQYQLIQGDDGAEVRLFKDIDAARAWLGLEQLESADTVA